MPQLHKLAGLVIAVSVLVGVIAPAYDRGTGPAVHAGHAGAPTETATPSRPPGPVTQRELADARAAGANELGEVPVIMYHRIAADPQAPLDRTPDQLRAEFVRLAEENYVPVTAAELAEGRIDIPVGTHPVVLTFDDSDPSHLAFDAGGAPEPDSAVGILFRVARERPGFRPVATMYVNADPFGMGDEDAAHALGWLVARGFELGNHTATHPDLSRLSKRQVISQVSRSQRMISDATGVTATTLAYPFGARPRKTAWARQGSAGAVDYDFSGIFLAGWRPSLSPFSAGFDPTMITRIQSGEKSGKNGCSRYCSAEWLDRLADHPAKRYTSDGEPALIAFPASKQEQLDEDLAARAAAYPGARD